jgi:hypothetical protein
MSLYSMLNGGVTPFGNTIAGAVTEFGGPESGSSSAALWACAQLRSSLTSTGGIAE